jgi:phytanoyl-CoA hydroxylase
MANGVSEKGLMPIEREEEFVMGEVKRGSLVLIHGNVLHKSERNSGKKSRFIYTFHVSPFWNQVSSVRKH